MATLILSRESTIPAFAGKTEEPVSYTHLALPTKRIV